MIKNFFLGLLILLGIYFIQIELINHISSYMYGLVPDVLLVFFCLFATSYGRLESEILGFCFGLVRDLLTGSPLCYYALIYLVLGFCFGSLYNKTNVNTLKGMPFLAIMASFTYPLLAFLISKIFTGSVRHISFSWYFAAKVILNVLMGFPVFYIVQFLANKMELQASWRRLRHE